MKNLIRVFVIFATSLAIFSACQKWFDTSKNKVRHSVKFIVETAETKTNAEIVGSNVNYSWTEDDQYRFTVYEILNGQVVNTATPDDEDNLALGSLSEGEMSISAYFDGESIQGASYQVLFNRGVKSNQISTSIVEDSEWDFEYDQESDVLLSEIKTPTAEESIGTGISVRFQRLVALGQMTLKGLTKGDKVSKVVIESIDDSVLAADYYYAEKEFSVNQAKSITLDNLELPINYENDVKVTKLRFISLPVESKLKVSVITSDNDNNIAGKYVKEFTKALILSQGDIKGFSVALTEAPKDAEITSFTATSGDINTDISYESFKGNAGTAPGVYGGCLRLYQNGAYVTIKGVKGVKIVGITATLSSTYDSTTIGYALNDDDAPTTGTEVAKNSEYKLEDIEARSVSLYCLGTDNKSRAEIASISVQYTKEAIELSSIALSGSYKTSFIQNEQFNYEGVVVTATYSDGDKLDVTNSATFSEPDMTQTGQQSVTVSYTEGETTKTATYDITISAEVVDSLALSGEYKTVFNVGDKFNHDGVVVTATYNSGRTEDVTASATFSTPDMNQQGSQTITISYGGKSVTYTITINSSDTIFYESFDTNDGTGGNDGQWSGSIASSNIKSDNEGWAFVNGNGASKCAKFGAGSKLGSATTPALNHSGYATLTFKAAAWNGNSESTTLKLSVVGDGTISSNSVTMTKGVWTEYTLRLSNLTVNSKIKFEGNSASNSRFFLDEVKIERAEAPTTYTVTVDESIANGSVTASPTSAIEGEEITLTATPNPGYKFKSWTVTNASTSAAITVTDNKFTMPAANVNVSATFSEIPALTTMDAIFTAATTVGSTAADTRITFDNWIVSGVKNKNAYVTDNDGKGLIIYADGHGFEVGDILSGTVNCKVQLFNGSSELTSLTSSTEGLTVKKGGVATPQEIALKDLSGVNTGAVLTFAELTYNGSVFTDGTTTITPYNIFTTLPTLINGRKYEVTGVYIQYDTTKEIAPRTAEDFVLIEAPYLTATASKTTGIAAAGETINVTVNTNVEGWTATSNNEAFAISNKTATSFDVVVSENSSTTDSRSATITVSATGVESVIINLTQSKKSSGGSTWTRCTSVSDLTSGGTFIIGYEATANSGKIIPMKNTGGTATTSAAGYMANGSEIDMANVTATTDYEVSIVSSTFVTGAICIKVGNNFIGNTNTKNNCKLFTEQSNTTAFGVTVGTNNVFTLKIAANTSYHTLQYNTGSPRFAVYGGAQKNLVIYKKN